MVNPYSRYAESNILSASPLDGVVALYNRALDALYASRRANEASDHSARGEGINGALDILCELLHSLDFEQGGDLSVRLADLYTYMQKRLLEAHIEQSEAALSEVIDLMSTLLEGWRAIANSPATNPVSELRASAA